MSALKIVQQLRALCSEEANRAAIVKDHGTLPALVLFLENDDTAVVKLSLEALEFLSLCVPTRGEMSRELGLKISLEKLAASSAESKHKEMAARILKNLNGAAVLQAKPIQTPPLQQPKKTASASSAAANTTTSSSSASVAPAGLGGLASSLSGFSAMRGAGQTAGVKALVAGQPAKPASVNKSLVLRVAMTSPRVRTVVEDALLSVRGVVSFTFDAEQSRFTVRARKDVEAEMLFDAILDSDDTIDVCQVVKGPDGKEQLVHPWREDEEEEGEDDEDDGYENENAKGKSNTAPTAAAPAAGTTAKAAGKRAQASEEQEEDDGYWDDYLNEEAKKKTAVTLQGHDFEADDKRAGGGWFGGIGSYLSKSIWG